MSHAHNKPVDTLSPYTRDRSAFGPSNTKTVQVRFAQRLRGVLGRINAALKRGIIEDDIFNLQDNTDTLAVDDPGPFETDSNPQLIAQFVSWLREQLDTEFLTVVGPDRNEFLRKAYAEGVRHAERELSDLDVSFPRADVDDLLGSGAHLRALQTLYTRTYSNLQSVRNDVVDDVRETLTEGLSAGENPRKIAQRLSERVDSIGKARSTLIARTEIANAHTQAFTNRMETAQESADITINMRHVGRLTAKDPRVCPFCRRVEDSVFTIDEFNSATTNFRGTTYRVGIPAHPNCRCVPVAETGEQDLPPLEERVPGTLITS